MGIHLMPPLFEIIIQPKPLLPPTTIIASSTWGMRYVGAINESWASCWGQAVATDIQGGANVGTWQVSGPQWIFERRVIYFDTSALSLKISIALGFFSVALSGLL